VPIWSKGCFSCCFHNVVFQTRSWLQVRKQFCAEKGDLQAKLVAAEHDVRQLTDANEKLKVETAAQQQRCDAACWLGPDVNSGLQVKNAFQLVNA